MMDPLKRSMEYISKELGAGIGTDPVVASNLHLCYHNTCSTDQARWGLFLAHICWPEENEFPESLFLVPKYNVPGYTRLMNRLELLYDQSC